MNPYSLKIWLTNRRDRHEERNLWTWVAGWSASNCNNEVSAPASGQGKISRVGRLIFRPFFIALLLSGCASVRYHYFHAELGPDDGVIVTQGYFPPRHLWIHADHHGNEQMAPDSTPMLDPSTLVTIWPFL